MEIKHHPINVLKLNPDNPRFIKDGAFKRLVKSLKELARTCLKHGLCFALTGPASLSLSREHATTGGERAEV